MVNIEPDWAIDLKFRNTTGKWLVVILSADGETVSAKIVGTDPGWEVEVDQPVITNIVRASSDMTYTDSPELDPGQTTPRGVGGGRVRRFDHPPRPGRR